MAIAPDSRRIVSGDVDGTVRLWDAYTGTEINRMPGPAGVITRVAFDRTGDVVASGSADGKIRLWDLTTGAVTPIDTGQPVTAFAMNPDGSLLAFAGIDGQITIRELSSGRSHRLKNDDNAIIFDLAFSPRAIGWRRAACPGLCAYGTLPAGKSGRPTPAGDCRNRSATSRRWRSDTRARFSVSRSVATADGSCPAAPSGRP